MNDTGNSFGSNPASLKGKLQTLEVAIIPFRTKSRTSPTSSTTTRRRCRFSVAKKILSSQSSPWRLPMSKRVSAMSWSVFRKKCTSCPIQEATLQFPKGRKQPYPATDHLPQRRKDSPSAATPRPAEKNHRAGDASRQLAVIASYLYHPHTISSIFSNN